MFWRSKTCFRALAAEKTMYFFVVSGLQYVKHFVGNLRQSRNCILLLKPGIKFQLSGAGFQPGGLFRGVGRFRPLFALNYLPKAHATTPIELAASKQRAPEYNHKITYSPDTPCPNPPLKSEDTPPPLRLPRQTFPQTQS